jgi:hypothetical protein
MQAILAWISLRAELDPGVAAGEGCSERLRLRLWRVRQSRNGAKIRSKLLTPGLVVIGAVAVPVPTRSPGWNPPSRFWLRR